MCRKFVTSCDRPLKSCNFVVICGDKIEIDNFIVTCGIDCRKSVPNLLCLAHHFSRLKNWIKVKFDRTPAL